MSFFDLEVLEEKPIKSKGIMPHLKLSKNVLLEQKNLKKNKNKKLVWTYENMFKF